MPDRQAPSALPRRWRTELDAVAWIVVLLRSFLRDDAHGGSSGARTFRIPVCHWANKNGAAAIVRKCASDGTQRRCLDRIAAIGDTIGGPSRSNDLQLIFSDIHAI